MNIALILGGIVAGLLVSAFLPKKKNNQNAIEQKK